MHQIGFGELTDPSHSSPRAFSTIAPEDAVLAPSHAPLLKTNDHDEARQYITDLYVPHDLVTRSAKQLNFRLRYSASSRLTVGRLAYGADAQLRLPPMVACYHMNLTVHGQTAITQRGLQAETRARKVGAIFSPTDPFTVRWNPETVQYAVKLPRRDLEGHLSNLIDRPVENPINFDLTFDLCSGEGEALLAAVTFLRDELARPCRVTGSPLARQQLESFVLTQLLLAIPNSYSDLLAQPGRPVDGSCVRRAIDLVQDNPIADWDIGKLSAAIGVTARSLQRGFRKETGLSPTGYVRAVRLDRVRADLLRATIDLTVTQVAMHWGFIHFGRFAQYYRDRFGELPSETRNTALALAGATQIGCWASS